MITVKVLGLGGQGPLSSGNFGGATGEKPGASAPASPGQQPENGKGAGAPAPVKSSQK